MFVNMSHSGEKIRLGIESCVIFDMFNGDILQVAARSRQLRINAD